MAPAIKYKRGVNAVHDRGMNSRVEDEGEKQGRIEIAVIVARCAASAPWQAVMLCLMRQQCRQLVPDMTLSVTNK